MILIFSFIFGVREVCEAKYWKTSNEAVPNSAVSSEPNSCHDLRPIPRLPSKEFRVRNEEQTKLFEDACENLVETFKDAENPYYPVTLLKINLYCEFTPEQNQDLFLKITAWFERNGASEKSHKWLQSALKLKLWSLTLDPDMLLDGVSLMTDKKEKEKILQEALAGENLPLESKEKITKKLAEISPRFTPIASFKSTDYFLYAAQDAVNANDADLSNKILRAFKKIKVLTFEQKKRSLEISKIAHKMQQDKKGAQVLSQQIMNLDIERYKKYPNEFSAKSLASSTVTAARALWTDHKTKAALANLNRVQKIIKTPFIFSEFDYLRARMDEEEGNKTAAIKKLEKIASQLPTDKNPYLWNMAWLEFKNADFSKANIIFDTILSDPDVDQGKRSQAWYWKGRALQNAAQAKESFEKVIQEDPNGYYAFLAYRELGKKIPTLPELSLGKAYPPSTFNIKLFDCLTKTLDWKLATAMLQEELPLEEKNSDHWNDILPLYGFAQAYGIAFLKISALPNKLKTELSKSNLALLFPILYENIIAQESEKAGLSKEYVLSIIRQESLFNPLAQSPADATGLMQLLPDIAKQIAKKNEIAYHSRDDLFDPVLNISLGTKHLKSYWELFNGNFILATAGYNASPDAARSWVSNRYNVDPTIFIEEIPYEETRSYVKLVSRNIINYLRRTKPDESFEFPAFLMMPIPEGKVSGLSKHKKHH